MKKIISFICVSVFASVSLFARDIVYKVSTYGDDANDGLTWATAKRTLGAAQAVAEYGDDIWVAAGIYYPTDGEYRYRWGGDSDDDVRYFAFQLKAGVRIYGGFPKLGNPDMNSRDTVNNKTIFSGNIGDSASRDDNSFRIFNNTDTTIDDLTVIDGLYIQDAYNDAMYNNGSSPLVRNCHFENNSSSITNENSASPIISDSVFKSTGAISGDSLNISKCEFSANSLAVNITGNATISNSKFVSNWKGVYIEGKTVSISNCSFEKNTGYSIEIENGYLVKIEDSSDLKVSNSSFIENTNTAVYGLKRGCFIDRCTFVGNKASQNFNRNYYNEGDYQYREYKCKNSCHSAAAVVMYDGELSNCNFIENITNTNCDNVSYSESKTNRGTISTTYYNFLERGFFAGAVYMEYGNITKCTFKNNKAESHTSYGKGKAKGNVYSAGGLLQRAGVVNGCTFIANDSRAYKRADVNTFSSGALIVLDGLTQNCTFTQNYSKSEYIESGAAYVGSGGAITFSTITENYTKGNNVTQQDAASPGGNIRGRRSNR